jgi:hypothetical protein
VINVSDNDFRLTRFAHEYCREHGGFVRSVLDLCAAVVAVVLVIVIVGT